MKKALSLFQQNKDADISIDNIRYEHSYHTKSLENIRFSRDLFFWEALKNHSFCPGLSISQNSFPVCFGKSPGEYVQNKDNL